MTQLKILNNLEQESFEYPPEFNSVSRKKYFAVPAGLRSELASRRKPSNKACLILMHGYFKAAKRFFGKRFNEKDIQYVARQLGCDRRDINLESLPDSTYQRYKKIVLQHFGCREFNSETKGIAASEIRAMVRSQLRPRVIIEELREILIRRKIEVPSYGTLSLLISNQINIHKRRMVKLTASLLPKKTKRSLDRLLKAAVSGEKNAPYELTVLKKYSHSVQPAAIKWNVEQLLALRELFEELQPVIDELDLSREGLRYLATYVLKSPSWELTTKHDSDRYLHIVSFVVHQYYKLQDHLVDVLLNSTRSIENAARKEHKDLCYEQRSKKNHSIAQIIDTVEELLRGYVQIDSIAHRKGQIADRKIELIKEFLDEHESVIANARKQVENLKETNHKTLQNIDFYAIWESFSVRLQNRVAGILKALEFKSDCSNKALYNAICYYKQADGNVSSAAPRDFLEGVERDSLVDEKGKFRVSLYKVLFFTKVAEAVRAGALSLDHSYRYRTLEEYMIPSISWGEEKKELLERAGLAIYDSCPAVLAELEQRLDQQYHLTNQHIKFGDNEFATIKRSGAYTVKTPPLPEKEVSSVSIHLPDAKYVALLEVLSTVNHVTNFLGEFSNAKLKYNRAKPSEPSYYAGLIGLGCGIGVKKIAQISQQIDEQELERAVNWHFTLENVEAANDSILAFMARLQLPSVYLQGDKLHTSSDGQKIDVTVPSVGAGHSFKYFGQRKGVSAYSFIDQRNFLFHSTVFSAAEREAAYVLDGLMRNDVFKSDIHSTDTHGYSEVIFGVSHLLGFMFAPRIRNLKRQRLYTFPGQYKRLYQEEEYLILPDGVLNTQHIVDNWDEILRFTTTIQLKETTASQLFRRLNSYSTTHPLWTALKEFGRAVKSTYILRYIDDLVLRQSIEKQLNKIESAQKFSNAVAFGSQELRQADREEQCITIACRRLIKNAIICWNYLYLSQRIVDAQSEAERTEIITAVQEGSVVAWRHINFYGEYDFSDEKLKDSIGLVLPLIQKLKVL